MIEFLKDSTFAVNDVINKSWVILYKNYKNIAGLCLTMFFLLWASTFLSSFATQGVSFFNIVAILGFLTIYLGLQLTLFKYILHAIQHQVVTDETFAGIFMEYLHKNWLKILIVVVVPLLFIFVMSLISSLFDLDNVLFSVLAVLMGFIFIVIRLWNQIKPFFFTIKQFWPSKKHFSRFLVALIISLLTFFCIVLFIGALLFPFALVGVPTDQLSQIAIPLGLFVAFIILIRISFFPFFILDQDCSIWKSIRFSMAVTRGNFTRLLILMLLMFLGQLISGYLQAKEYYFLSLAISLVYSLIIVPLSSVIIAVAYRQMMDSYEGDPDPDILGNII